MARVTAKSMPAGHGTRLWMFLAFTAGIIFTAVLAQTLATMNEVTPASPGSHDSSTPVSSPVDGYLVKVTLNTTCNS